MTEITASNGVVYLKSNKLKVCHGFATRLGGVSANEHTSSLNLAFGRGDEREVVLRNLELFADAVGFDAQSIVSVSQIHSADVRVVSEADAGQGYFGEEAFACDGYVTNTPGITLGIKTADCVPILMEACDEAGRVIAVGAVHAGWRGSVGKIAAECIKKLSAFGASPENVRVCIGPAICGECYTVREDFYVAVRDALGERDTERFVIPTSQSGVWRCDLRDMNREILIAAGVRAENIEVSDDCTCCMPQKYFSHRFTCGKRGTMLSVISMP